MAEARYALVGGLLLAGVWAVTDRSLRELVAGTGLKAAALMLPGVLLVTSGAAWAQFRDWSADGTSTAPEFGLPSLDGTAVSGTVTDSAILRLAVEQAYPKVKKLVERQELATSTFVSGAIAQLQGARAAMEGPAADEVAVMMQSDMHCNAAMTKVQHEVVSMLDDAYGKDTISCGDHRRPDHQRDGGRARLRRGRGCDRERRPGRGGDRQPRERPQRAQMKGAGMHVLEGGAEKLAGISVLGADDPGAHRDVRRPPGSRGTPPRPRSARTCAPPPSRHTPTWCCCTRPTRRRASWVPT